MSPPPRTAPASKASPLLYWLSLVAPLTTLAGNLVGGPAAFASGALVWAGLSSLEALRWEGPKASEARQGAGQNALLFVHVLVQLACIASLALLAERGAPGWVLAGAVWSTGTTTGSSAFIVAHELMHRKSPFERFFSWVLLGTCLFTHFHVEHVHVHHRRVGTDDDPASARATDNPYRFVLRSTWGQLAHAWQVAWRKFPEQRGGPRTPYLTALLAAAVANLLAVVGIFLLSPLGGVLFLAQAALATFLLNLVNYVEHWGLRRSPDEPVTPAHSWDTDSFITRYTLFELGMHADHHTRAAKPYWALGASSQAPRMPVGLYGATILALCPPLFRAVFQPALDAHLRRSPPARSARAAAA